MKLIIQSDDFGMTEAVSCGIIKAVREGLVTCTGLFSNMPAAPLAAEMLKAYPQVCLGEDMNLVAGRPCADPKQLPSLVQADGSFKTSGMQRQLDQTTGSQEHVVYEECLLEMEAQIKRFIDLTGKKPEYLHGHSYSTPAIVKAMHFLGEKYTIPLTRDMWQRFKMLRPSKKWTKKPFPLAEQLQTDPLGCICEDEDFLKQEIGFIGTHCGFVDAELFQVSTFTLMRTRDLAAVTSIRLKEWVEHHKIELISYRDLL